MRTENKIVAAARASEGPSGVEHGISHLPTLNVMADYDSIPTAGTHRGPEQPHDPDGSVRAPASDDATSDDAGDVTNADAHRLQLVQAPDQSSYHLRPFDESRPLERGHVEIGQFDEVGAALQALPTLPRFVVLENPDTGEMRLTQDSDLTANWTDGGRFDRITLFEHESDAATYVASRQG